jgi:hypothetical protein
MNQNAVDNPKFERWNRTSIGNNAFLLLRSTDQEIKDISKRILDGYRVWLKSPSDNVGDIW